MGEDMKNLERSGGSRAHAGGLAGPKTILVHLQDDGSVDSRLESALSLARACSAHLSALHVTPIAAYVAFDSFGGVFVMNDVIKTLEEQETALQARIERELDGEDVSWDYRQVTGDVANQVIGQAALADLVVVGRQPHRSDFVGPAIGFLGDLLGRLRTPMCIPADDGPPSDPTGTAMIAWDGSYEAANTVRSSLALLSLASSVQVVQVAEDKKEYFPGMSLLRYLSRHGIHAELTVENARPDSSQALAADVLVERARELNASYMVMGGYNHSRIGEYVFGGVTRTMLAGSPVPIVISR